MQAACGERGWSALSAGGPKDERQLSSPELLRQAGHLFETPQHTSYGCVPNTAGALAPLAAEALALTSSAESASATLLCSLHPATFSLPDILDLGYVPVVYHCHRRCCLADALMPLNSSYTCSTGCWRPVTPPPTLDCIDPSALSSGASPTCSSFGGGRRTAGPRALRGGCVDSSLAGTLLLHGHMQSQSQLRVQVGVHTKLIGVAATYRGKQTGKQSSWGGQSLTITSVACVLCTKAKQTSAGGSPRLCDACAGSNRTHIEALAVLSLILKASDQCHVCSWWTPSLRSPAAGAPSPPPPAANPVALSPWKIAVPNRESDNIIPGCTVTCRKESRDIWKRWPNLTTLLLP